MVSALRTILIIPEGNTATFNFQLYTFNFFHSMTASSSQRLFMGLSA